MRSLERGTVQLVPSLIWMESETVGTTLHYTMLHYTS